MPHQISLLASCADWGTRSISNAYERLLKPAESHFLDRGFKRTGFNGLFAAGRFIARQERANRNVLCLFNAPVLVAALTPRFRRLPRLAILDWTEAFPSGKTGLTMEIYNQMYLWAFRRLDSVASPVEGFRNFYNSRGARINPCLYPLPHSAAEAVERLAPNPVKLLFVGADFVRKGGDVLLEMWAARRPANTELTFVCPKPPLPALPSVNYRTDIRVGSPEHDELFRTHDILILPSRNEPFGYVALEATSRGMIVATTRCAGCSFLVEEAGGVVEESPEGVVESAFNLSSAAVNIPERSRRSVEFAKNYETRVIDSLSALFNACP